MRMCQKLASAVAELFWSKWQNMNKCKSVRSKTPSKGVLSRRRKYNKEMNFTKVQILILKLLYTTWNDDETFLLKLNKGSNLPQSDSGFLFLESPTERFRLEGTSLVQALVHSRATLKHDQVTQGLLPVFSEQLWVEVLYLPWLLCQGWTTLGVRIFFIFSVNFPSCQLGPLPVVFLLCTSENN